MRTKAIAEHQGTRSALAHRLPVGIGYFLIAFPKLAFWNRPVIPHFPSALLGGAVICISGLYVTLWARWTLAGNWSSDVTFKEGHELIKSGPYRFVRHPIYTGLLMMCLGTAIDNGKLRCFLGTMIVTVGFWIKLKQEERLMLRHFPDQYPAYQKQVKALVPFLI